MTDKSFEVLSDSIKIRVTAEHRFGTDAFLLADFAFPRHKDVVCDLGTGCGIIPLLMVKAFSPKKIYALDIQEQAIEQLRESIEVSSVDTVEPICADLKELWKDAPLGQCDVVTCNPPYKAYKAGIESEMTAQKIARHEILCDINDVCRAGSRLLKFGGKLCVCNRPERLADVICAMRANGIEPKTMRAVSKTSADEPWLFLLEGRKGGKPFMRILPQLYIKSGDGFSDELTRIYNRGKENI